MTSHRAWRIFRVAGAACLVVALVYAVLDRFVLPGAQLLRRLAAPPPAAPADPTAPEAWSEEETSLPSRGGHALRARVYRPAQATARTMVLVHGLHREGIDGRAVLAARALASLGHTVVTPEIAALTRYELSATSVDEIEDAVRWAFAARDLAPERADRRVGLCGVSFAGGLALSAAGRPGMDERLAFVVSLGGHADLEGLLATFCSGALPSGAEPHIYAVALVLHELAGRLVPPAEVEPLRAAIRLFLEEREAETREAAARLSDDARAFVEMCIREDGRALGRAMAGRVREVRFPPALSPLRSPPPRCPVFLLHGAADTVIPPEESTRVAAYLGPRADVTLLISSLVTHVEVDLRTSIELVRVAAVLTRLRRM